MSLRILLSAYACRPGLGSEPGIGWNWALQLSEAGANVSVLTREDNKDAIEEFLGDNCPPNLHFIYVKHRRIAKLFERFGIMQSWQHVLWQDVAFDVAKSIHENHRFDIAHHVSYGSLHIGSRLWRLTCPLVFGPVGGAQVAPPGFREHFQGGWALECVRSFVARHLYRYILNARSTVKGAKCVLVANQDTETAVRSLGGSDVRFMVDIGLRPEQITSITPVLTSRQQPLKILWAARLLPRKGLLLALEAMALIGVDTQWTLTIIGDGPQGPMVRKWIDRLKLGTKVNWRGKVSFQEVQSSLDRSDLFLFTSLRDTNGGQLLEAMARGVPILTLNHHGASTLIPDAVGIKVTVSTPIETAYALARSIEKLAADRDLLLKMSKAAKQTASFHTWDLRASQALAIYEQILDKKINETAIPV